MEIKEFARKIHKTTLEKGFWDSVLPPNIMMREKLLLIHSEISEATEEIREGRYSMIEIDGKPEGLVVELADAIIRILDLCEFYKFDICDALEKKAEYNKTRTRKHGKLF